MKLIHGDLTAEDPGMPYNLCLARALSAVLHLGPIRRSHRVCSAVEVFPHRACSAVVIALLSGIQGCGFEPGLFHKACYMPLDG